MVHQHYGTQTLNRGAVQPGMLVKHNDSTWTASANARGRLYLHPGSERTYIKDLLVEVYLNGLGNGLSHLQWSYAGEEIRLPPLRKAD
ncbi:TPA: cell division inhibitor protein [Klebsiella aerogenes]|nr:cell division inhibitor protein [Klebsiella aerogenes]